MGGGATVTVILLLPLDLVLAILGVLMFLGVGWATMLGAWLWSHALIIGIILLVIHVIYCLGTVLLVNDDYGIMGIVCSIIHIPFSLLIVISAYQAMLESEKNFGVGILFEWLLCFGCISGIECLWVKATDTKGGLSYFRLIIFTAIYVVISFFLINLIKREGF